MKTLKELEGVKQLSKSEQKAITGGRACEESADCISLGPRWCCIKNVCTHSAYACMY